MYKCSIQRCQANLHVYSIHPHVNSISIPPMHDAPGKQIVIVICTSKSDEGCKGQIGYPVTRVVCGTHTNSPPTQLCSVTCKEKQIATVMFTKSDAGCRCIANRISSQRIMRDVQHVQTLYVYPAGDELFKEDIQCNREKGERRRIKEFNCTT